MRGLAINHVYYLGVSIYFWTVFFSSNSLLCHLSVKYRYFHLDIKFQIHIFPIGVKLGRDFLFQIFIYYHCTFLILLWWKHMKKHCKLNSVVCFCSEINWCIIRYGSTFLRRWNGIMIRACIKNLYLLINYIFCNVYL